MKLFKNFAWMVLVLMSCELAERDPLEPGLPEYTEKGINSVGATINGLLWRDFNEIGWLNGSNSYMSIAFDTLTTKSRIIFNAGLVTGNVTTDPASVFIDFNDRLIRTQDDLLSLNDSRLRIDGDLIDAGVNTQYFDALICPANHGSSGNLYIRRVSYSLDEEGINQGVFSGTFGFTVTSDCGQVNVFSGRFDYNFRAIGFVADSL